MKHTCAPHMTADCATLKLDNQKNGWHGVCINHKWNGDDTFDAVRALSRQYIHIRENSNSNWMAYLSTVFEDGVKSHWTWMKLIQVWFTIVYRTWIGTISDLPPTVHVRYTSGSTDARSVHVLLVYVMYIFHPLIINVYRT